MGTTINYTDRYGKKRSKTFDNKDSLLEHLSDEVQRLEIRRMTVEDKKEIRKLLKAEMSLLNMMEYYSKRFGANGIEMAAFDCKYETPENNSRGVQ